MQEDLQLAGLAESTQKAYLQAVRRFAAHFHRPPDQISEQEFREYLLYLKNRRHYSAGSLRVAASAILFFFTHTVPRDWPTFETLSIPRPKTLPDVLSIDEVRRLIDAVRTPHNKAFFWTVYSLGLRVQEALNLQVGDIDSARMVVHVHRGKGAKDRFVPLPPRTLDVLRHYWSTHRHPEWLFPARGRDHDLAGFATRPMAPSSVNHALQQLVLELGIALRDKARESSLRDAPSMPSARDRPPNPPIRVPKLPVHLDRAPILRSRSAPVRANSRCPFGAPCRRPPECLDFEHR
jgi:integrase